VMSDEKQTFCPLITHYSSLITEVLI
jgi:hypothetical protein